MKPFTQLSADELNKMDKHVHVYASKKNDGTIIKAQRPADLFRNSIATPSLVSLIISNKFEKHLPLDRQSQLFQKEGIRLETNTLANWMIRSSEDYFSLLWDLLKSHPLQHHRDRKSE